MTEREGLEPRREVLENGLVLLRSQRSDTASVAVRGSFPAGAAREAPEHAGLASFTARMLRRGTTRHSAQEIAERIEEIGGSFAVWGGTEEAGFSAKCLGRDLPVVLDLLQDVLEAPAFAEDEIAKTRGEVLTQLREQEDSTRARVDRAMMELLYPPDHPYSRSSVGQRETVEALTGEHLRAFHNTWYAAPGARVVVSGAFDTESVRARLGRWFPGRPAPAPLPDLRVQPSAEPRRAEVSLSHKSQVDLLMAGPGIPREHPDFYALSMISLVLGGLGLMGRLGERVREEQGLAYSVSCRSNSRLWSGEWVASAGVAPENVERVVEAVRAEVQRARDELVSEEELADAQDYLVGSLPLRLETNEGVAAYLLNSEYYGLGLDYLHRYPGYIRALTREGLREAARRHLDPAALSVAVAGPI